jgi:hypothetical protein
MVIRPTLTPDELGVRKSRPPDLSLKNHVDDTGLGKEGKRRGPTWGERKENSTVI